jgi:hypothetical protein
MFVCLNYFAVLVALYSFLEMGILLLVMDAVIAKRKLPTISDSQMLQ